MNPKCPQCNETNPLNFYPDNRKPGKYQTFCKDCARVRRREWAQKNEDRVKEYHKKYYAKLRNDPERWQEYLNYLAKKRSETRLYDQVSNANKRAKKRSIKGKIKTKDWRDLILNTPQCPGCNEPWAFVGRPTLDHIVPLAKRGLNTIQNVQPLCAGCHARKVLSIKRFLRKKKKNRETL